MYNETFINGVFEFTVTHKGENILTIRVPGREFSRVLELRQVERTRDLESCDLSKGMDASVCSACHFHPGRRVQNPGQHRFKCSLDGDSIRLDLPAVVVGAIVFDQELVLQGVYRSQWYVNK